MAYFLDTNCVLSCFDRLETYENFYISGETFVELDNIKSSRNKAEDLRYRARQAIKWLNENEDKYNVVVVMDEIYRICENHGLDTSRPDNIICSCAFFVKDDIDKFVSSDGNCRNIARKIFGLDAINIVETEDNDDYTGFKIVSSPSEEEWADCYSKDAVENRYNLKTNEYLILTDGTGEPTDTFRWTGSNYVQIYNKTVKSIYFDKLKPKDVYQKCVVDSIMNNTLTAISGRAGSGKSMLSVMTAMHLIETGKYDRLVVMFNPTKTRGAADLGFYGGTFLDKAMQSNIGQILTTKFGDASYVDILMGQEKIKLLSMADARGTEIRDNEIMWITEAQNTSIDLIKLCLSRVSSGAKVIIEGDYNSQVDHYSFEGENNGLKRVIDAFQGHEEFGYIQLQNVWRSKIAELCELL